MLLWRSVAICLGAEEQLRSRNASEGARIAVVDRQSANTVNISILTLHRDRDRLVPARSAFRKRENYPVVNQKTLQMAVPSSNWQKDAFCRHTWQRSGIHFVPDGKGGWEEYCFQPPKQRFLWHPDSVMKQNIDFFIISGSCEFPFLQALPERMRIFEPVGENFAARGAGRFAVRNTNNLPTYFDECESLYFIVQDCNEEKIVAKPLIRGGELCRGGRKIEGEINRDFFLEKDCASITFLLHLGEIANDTPLKELHQDLRKSTERQPLTLYPSMIPGQGIAQVLVEAAPLLREAIELDFLKMSEACYVDKKQQKHPKTIEYLQTILPRSFPMDFPEVEASATIYKQYCSEEVWQFLHRNSPLSSGCFYHPDW